MSYKLMHAVKKYSLLPCLLVALGLVGCGSDDDDQQTASSSSSSSSSSSVSSSSSNSSVAPGHWPDLNVAAASTGSLRIYWDPVPGSSFYRLYKDPDGSSGFSQVGEDVTDPEAFDQISAHLANWPEARYMVEACSSASDCSNSNEAVALNAMLDSIGYMKASNTEMNDWFGWSVDLSDDGTTLAVGAPQENSKAQGINGDQTDNSTFAAGAVYVFTHTSGHYWQQQAYIKASNTQQPFENDEGVTLVRGNGRFGYSVSLSDDGNTLAVGALGEPSNATGINGDQSDDSAPYAGAVYLFQRSDSDWTQTAYVKASNTLEEATQESSSSSSGSSSSAAANITGDRFGHSVALSGDGATLAVGALGESSNLSGINPEQADDKRVKASASGAVYVFAKNNTDWAQQAYIKAKYPRPNTLFGESVSLSYSGDTLAVGASGEDQPGYGVDQEIPEKTRKNSGVGAVFIYTRDAGVWQRTSYIKPAYAPRFYLPRNTADRSLLYFGTSVSLSHDGKRLLVGAPGEGSRATGVNGDPQDYTEADPNLTNDMVSYLGSGAAYVFDHLAQGWTQSSYIKASNPAPKEAFGTSVRISGDGRYLAIGAHMEGGAALGINGDDTDKRASNSGAVYIFAQREDQQWYQHSYVKAPQSAAYDRLGRSLSLSADGSRLAAGAYRESGAGTGPDADPSDQSAEAAGAVYLY